MSFHPDGYDGFDESCCCPHCGSSDFQYEDDLGVEYGTASVFQIDGVRCDDCGEKFILVSFLETERYGSIPYNEYYGVGASENRRPKATSKKPQVKANKDGSASINSLKKIQAKRSPAAIKADERKKAKNTVHRATKTGYKPVSMAEAKKWARSPGSMDIQGVDTKPKYPKRRN